MSLNFKRAEQVRLDLTAQQQREIRDLYQSVADDIADRLAQPQRVPSDSLREWYLKDLQKQVNSALEGVGKTTEGTIQSNAQKVAESVVGCNADWLKSVGMPIGGAFSWVPTDVVTSVATGQIYEGPWSLSSAIWYDVQNQQKDIQTIIARGIAENKSAFDIAKDLERYVDPSAAKPWDWSTVYPGVRRQIDYSAQRLARTMVSHAYQQSFVRTTQKNPFVTKYKWEASNSDRMCDLCRDRNGNYYSKDDLPLDHPNGMCTFTAVIEDNMDQIADRLADWANGAEDPELESWAKDMYGDKWQTVKKTAKPKSSKKSGSTAKQSKKAAAWDKQYENVVEFAKSRGLNVDSTVKSILGDPPPGSIHYGQSSYKATEAFTIKQPKSDFRASGVSHMNRDSANQYIKSMLSGQNYSAGLKSAMDDYMMFSDDMNGYLRGLSRYNEYGSSINLLSKSMHQGPQEIVFRGCDSKTLGISPTLSEQQIQQRLVGSVLRDKGFLSTSKAYDVAVEFSGRGIDGDEAQMPTIMTILLPESSSRLYVNSGLGEVLLDRGSGMEVTEAYVRDGSLYVTASVMP